MFSCHITITEKISVPERKIIDGERWELLGKTDYPVSRLIPAFSQPLPVADRSSIDGVSSGSRILHDQAHKSFLHVCRDEEIQSPLMLVEVGRTADN